MALRFPAAVLVSVVLCSVPAAAQTQTPVRVGGDIPQPVRTEYVAPVYPALAQAAKMQGTVIIEATIGPDGRVTDVRVLRPTPILDAAAIEAVRKWRYTPTMLNGVAVPVMMPVTVNFGPENQLAQPARNIVTAPADPKVIVVPQGYAVVDVTIGTNGAVREVTLVKGDAALAAATLDTIRTWRYAPTLLNGAPIEVKMTVLVPIK